MKPGLISGLEKQTPSLEGRNCKELMAICNLPKQEERRYREGIVDVRVYSRFVANICLIKDIIKTES